MLRRIESPGAVEIGHRALRNYGQVFLYGIATGRAERDPTGDVRGTLPPPKERHHASIIEPKRIGTLLRAIDTYEGFFVTKWALRFVSLVFVRLNTGMAMSDMRRGVPAGYINSRTG